MKTFRYTIPIEHGNHAVCLIIGDNSKRATSYIRKKYFVDLDENNELEDCQAFFYGHEAILFLYIHKDTPLEFIAHEIVHCVSYMQKKDVYKA